MGNIKETFLKKYGVWEYVLFIFGAIVMGYQTYKYLTDSLEGTALDGIVFMIALGALVAPMSLVNFIRKRAGVEEK